MKRLSFLLGCGVVCFALFKSNPRLKAPFVGHIAQRAQANCCPSPPDSTITNCEWLRPIARPVLYSVFYFYTEQPDDYFLLTKYTTRMPTHTVHGVGIAGQFFSWNNFYTEKSTCDTLYSALPEALWR